MKGTIRILLALLFDESTAAVLQKRLSSKGGQALVSINKALVTRASAVIPAVPLYISLLYRVMKEKKLHEGCIQQMYRMFNDSLFSGEAPEPDNQGIPCRIPQASWLWNAGSGLRS